MRYDKAYFDRWYRHPRHKVRTRTELARQAGFVVSAAELLLNAPVRTVLDVGAGEGEWLPALRRLRSNVRYWGIDPSPYAVSRFGRTRNVRLGKAAALDKVEGLPSGFDLVICAGVLMYLPPSEVRRALAQIAARTDGMAYLEIYTRRDLSRIEGDTRNIAPRSAAWYRRALAEAGLIACGLHCYVTDRLAGRVTELERLQ